MRIGIDVRYLSHGLVGGVHTYVAQFVPALIDLAGEHQIYLYADTKRPFELASSLPSAVTLRRLSWRTGLSSLYLDFFMQRTMANDRLDVVHFPANYGFGPPGVRTVITLHDEINIMPWQAIINGHRKDMRTVAMMTYLHWCSTISIRHAALIITDSKYARQQIARYSGLDPGRILPIYHAPTPDMQRVDDPVILANVRQRYNLTKRFVLADALKNPAVLVRAWRRLPPEVRTGREIVFFSRRADPLPIIREAVAEGIAVLLIRPSRPDLTALYSQAEAFVFPSWIEGFGLPILEAMTCGAPVIASDRGSIPEVAGGAALLVDAEDDIVLAEQLQKVLTSAPETQRLRRLSTARAAQFTWMRTAKQVLESYVLAGQRLPVGGAPFTDRSGRRVL